MKTKVEKSIEQYEQRIKELSAIKHLEGISFIEGNFVYFMEQTYENNLKKATEIADLTKTELSLDRYYECRGRLALIYTSSKLELGFALYCTDLQETLNLFGCKLVAHEVTEKSYSIECTLNK